MLISRGLRTLLLGLAAAASVLGHHSPPTRRAPVQVSRGRQEATRSALQDSSPRGPERIRWRQSAPRGRRLRARQELRQELVCQRTNSSASPCPSDSTCCPASDGGFSCCQPGSACCLLEDGGTGCCPLPQSTLVSLPSTLAVAASSRTSTVLVTQTFTRTVTVFTGSPTTRLVTATNTIVLTLLNPTERTQTATVTATSFFPAAQRSTGSIQIDTIGKRQEPTVTSTVTAQVLTTVFRPSAILATITNTVFSTKFVAPNAITTVFVTTTVFAPSGAIPSTVPPTTAPIPSPSTVLSPTASDATLSSSSPPPPTSTPASSTEPTSPTSRVPPETTMMMTMSGAIPTTTATPVPSMVPEPATAPRFTVTQIVGITIGSVLGLLVLVLLVLGIRRLVQRRRAAQAQMRQQLTPPENGPSGPVAAMAIAPRRGPSGRSGQGALAGAALATDGSATSSSAASAPSNHSMLTGEGEVRIVIRPAPKRRTQSSQLWPMPPGHRGQTYSLFVEEATTGETTPQDPGAWSIASERGSVKDGREGANNNNNKTTVYSTGDYGERASGSGGRPSTSIFSTGWDRETSFGARSEGSSYPGMGTLLTPPPAWHGASTDGRWPRDPASYEGDNDAAPGTSRGNGEGPPREGYQMGSLGIGKAW